jgi:hypothetical protein
MRAKSLLASVALLAASAYAQEARAYLSGNLVQADSVQCGYSDGAETKITAQSKTSVPVCTEYVLEADEAIYRIRPKDAKNAVSLPVGQRAQFRLRNNVLLLAVAAPDNTEREYIVVSMKPRAGRALEEHPIRLNHLQ